MAKKNNYYIFTVEKDEKDPYREKRTKMMEFHAENDKEAYEFLKEYKKVANKEFTYYYDELGKYISKESDGTERVFDDMDEMMSDYRNSHNSVFDRIASWFRVKKMAFDEAMFNRRNLKYYKKTGHSIGECWDVLGHILGDVEFNVKKLMEECTTVPQYYEVLAYKKIHGDSSDTEYFDSPSRRIYDGDEKEYLLAKELWNKDLEKLLEDIRLYFYYNDHGIVDLKNEDYVKIDEKYRKTLPYVPGKYKVFDYKMLEAVKTKTKNRIFEFLRKYGESLGD